MKRFCFPSIVLLLLVAASSAVAQDVRYNFDQSASFSGYKTYRWVPIKDAAKLSDLLDKQIKTAFDEELAKKGLTRVEENNVDLFIGYQAAVGQEKQFSSYNTGWGYGPGWGWYGGGMGSSTTYGQTSTIYVGQLALDMYDAAKHELIWRSLATKTLDEKAKPEKQQKNLKKAVAKMLKNYPPKQK